MNKDCKAIEDNNLRINTVEDFNRWAHRETVHPSVSSFTHPENVQVEAMRHHYGVYLVVLMTDYAGDIIYGDGKYEYDEGTMIFISPGQVSDFRHLYPEYVPKGRVVLWNPDFITDTSLAQKMAKYTFFSYKIREALHLTERERVIVNQLMDNIEELTNEERCKETDSLIVANIELLLSYCQRFYGRQFKTHTRENNALISRLESFLNGYLSSSEPIKSGLPNVAFCADRLNMSPSYLSDLIKSATGKSALKYIHEKLVEFAKYRLANSEKTVNEVAYSLGFEYPQHFTRFFKKNTGLSPSDYRRMKE